MSSLNKKILIVEDDKDFIYILQAKFTGEGFFVLTAANGEDGINIAKREKPDLILSDILMPKVDGISMGKEIREFDKNVPLIFLTNIKDVDYADSIKNLGLADSLIKSELRINDIVEKVKIKLEIKTDNKE